MMDFIRKLMLLPRLLKILKLIDQKKLKGLNDILERVYPGIKDEIERLVEHADIHAMSKTLDYIKAHGGYDKIAEYYNNADQKGQDEMLSAFNEAFRPGAPFEDAVLTLDSLAKVKDMGLYPQLFGDVKDSIVMTSIKLGYRTVDDWRTFVRRQHEANKDVVLGVLNEIHEDGNSNNKGGYELPMELLSALYTYDNVIFKHIDTEYEFVGIIIREQHEHKLVECQGKKVLMYHIIERLSRLLPEDKRKDWREEIAKECGYDATTIGKKFNDTTNMKPENLKLFNELDRLFSKYDTTT